VSEMNDDSYATLSQSDRSITINKSYNRDFTLYLIVLSLLMMYEYSNCLKYQIAKHLSSHCNEKLIEGLQLNTRFSFMICQRLSIIIVDIECLYMSHISNFKLQNVQNQFIYHSFPQTDN
jgi:hypothetical protein